eukprot:scaffold121901_cov21-Phaeocystis_antarctica.AAC.1
MAIGGGMSDFGTGRQQATVPERPRMCASRVRRAAQARSLAPQAACPGQQAVAPPRQHSEHAGA